MKDFSRGFSRLEFILIVALVCLLTSIVVASLTSSPARERDAKRMRDLGKIGEALSSYAVKFGTYPIATATTTLTSTSTVGSALISVGISPAILSDQSIYRYAYVSNPKGGTYRIGFCLETASIEGYRVGCNNYRTPEH